MKIKLFKDEYDWSQEGFHVLNELGFAQVVPEDCEREIDDSEVDRVLAIVREGRILKGLDPDTGLPPVLPEPEPEPAPEEV